MDSIRPSSTREKRVLEWSRTGVSHSFAVGRGCIRNMRITAGLIVSLVAQGASNEEILDDHPDLEEEDIAAA